MPLTLGTIGLGLAQQQAGDSTPEPAAFQPGLGALLFNDNAFSLADKTALWDRFKAAGYHYTAWKGDSSITSGDADAEIQEFVNDYGNEYQVYVVNPCNAFRLADGEDLEAHITDAVAAGGLTVIDDPAPTFAGQKAAVLTIDFPVGFDYETDGTELTSGAKTIGGSTIAGISQSYDGVLFIPAGSTGVPAAMCEIPLWITAAGLLKFGIWDAHTYAGEAGGFTTTDAITMYRYGSDEAVPAYTFDQAGLAAYIAHWKYLAESREALGVAPSGWAEGLSKGFLPTQYEIVDAAVLAGLSNYYATGSNAFAYYKRNSINVMGHHGIDFSATKEAIWADIADKTRRGVVCMSQLGNYGEETWSEEAGDWAKLDYVLAKCLEYQIPVMLPSELPNSYYEVTAINTNSLPSLTTDLVNETPTAPTGWDWTAAANAVPNLATGEVTIDQTGTILSIEDFYAWKRGVSQFTIKMKNDGTAADVITVTIAGVVTNPTFSVNGTGWQTFSYYVPIAQTYNSPIDIDVVVTTKNSSGNITVKEPTFAYINDVLPPVITVSTDDPITIKSTHSITCATASSKIYYTVNGDTPTTGSTLYSAPFTIAAGEDVVIKAISYDSTDTYFYGDGTTPTVVSSAAFDVISGLEAETTALLSAMGASAPTDEDIIAAYDQLFYDLKNATVSGSGVDLLAKLDWLHLFYTAHSDQTDTLLNVIAPTGYAATLGHGADPSADPTWAAKAGFTTDATNWVNTGFVPSAGSKYAAQAGNGSCMFIVQHADPTASNLYEFGAQAAAGATTACYARLREAANGNVLARLNGGSAASSGTIASTTKRYLLVTRLAGGGALSFADENGFVTSSANAEGTIPDVTVWIGGYNNNGTLTSAKIAFPAIFGAGSAMTEAQWIVFRGILATYLAAMAAI